MAIFTYPIMKTKTEPIDFYRIIGERIKKFPTIRIGRTTEQFLQKEVVSRIGVADMNGLRDRFEGQRFLDNHRARLFASIAVREFIGETIRTQTLKLLEENNNFITINERRYEILTLPFGTLPQFKRENYNDPIVLVFQRDMFSMCIVGILEPDEIFNEKNYVTNNSNREFVAFDKIRDVTHGF